MKMKSIQISEFILLTFGHGWEYLETWKLWGFWFFWFWFPSCTKKKKKKTGLGNKSKFLFVFYNSVPHWWNIHLRGTPRVSLTRVSSLQEFKSTRTANLDHVSRRNSQTRAYFSCRTQYHLIPNFCNPVLS